MVKNKLFCHSCEALLHEPENGLGVIPWLDHGIQKITKNTNNISIFNWIPRSKSRDDSST
ncbi:hypothetical protein [Rickettsia tamurae]|uniref:hypothetical protein n=1 Tax=Rickettsia tamurae TaxID=334545 RepID=UPI0001A60958|nr:AmpG [Rickettsia endosymbiont of Ixodes scapularis]